MAWAFDGCDHPGIGQELSERIEDWVALVLYAKPPDGLDQFDHSAHAAEGRALARALKREAGERIHVEFEELVEIRMDGTERDRHQELMGREP